LIGKIPKEDEIIIIKILKMIPNKTNSNKKIKIKFE